MPNRRRQRERVKSPAAEESAVAELADPADVTCPRSEGHGPGRFYHAEGRDGFFVCDECGHEWTASVRYVESLTEYCLLVAEAIETAPTQQDDDGTAVIVWPADDAKETAKALRQLATGEPQSVDPREVRRYRLPTRERTESPERPSLADTVMSWLPGRRR